MNTQREDLLVRAREVARFIRHIKDQEPKLSGELTSTMRASAFLLIYNMVESSARALTDLIVDVVKSQKLSLADLSPMLRREFLRQAYKKNSHYSLVAFLDDRSGLVASYYDNEELFTGNVDAHKIKDRLLSLGCGDHDLGKAIGFSTRSMGDLLDIRNDLAHGNKTFGAIGGFYQHEDLVTTFTIALRVLRYAFAQVEGLLERNGHLWPAAIPSTPAL